MSRSTAAALPFGLTDEQQTVSGMVREFADTEVAPHALEWDAEHFFPVDVIKRTADLGMGGIYVSEEAGGTGMGRMDAALIFEAMSTGCPSVAAYISIHNMVAWMIDKFGNDEQKAKYLTKLVSMEHLGSYCLTEPNAGSDAAALRTTAREDGDHYVLNGVKQFISGARHLRDLPRHGPVRSGRRARNLSAFILEKGMEGPSFGPNEQKMGWRAHPTRQVIMENVRVPKENMLGDPGQGFKIAMSGLDGGRLNIAACSLGGGQAAFGRPSPTWANDRPSAPNSGFKRCASRWPDAGRPPEGA